MAMPCNPGLRPQSDWIVFSAPEMTTVSKPKRNPASADVRDQKKMRPFISEYRPRNSDFGPRTSDFGRQTSDLRPPTSVARHWLWPDVRGPVFPLGPRSCLQRIAFLTPIPNSAVHRNHILVAHLLQVVGGQSRAEASTAIQHQLGVKRGNPRLDVALDDAFAQMKGPGEMVLGEFAFLPHIHQRELLSAIQSGFHF